MVDPKLQDKLPAVYDAWQDLFSRKAADKLPSHSEGDQKIRVHQNSKLKTAKPQTTNRVSLAEWN